MYAIESRFRTRNGSSFASMVHGGKGRVRRLKRAQILLAADAGATDETIATNVAVGTVDGLPDQAPLRRGGAGARRSARSRVPARSASCRRARRRCWWRSPARSRPPGRARWTLRAARRRDGASDRAHESISLGDDSSAAGREGAEAVAEEDVVHPEGRRRVRRPDGGRARALRRGPGRAMPGRVLRRDPSAAHRRGARAGDAPSPGKRARYDYEYVRNGTANVFMFVDVASAVAPRQGDRAAHGRRLRRVHARPRRRALPAGRADPRRARQPLDAHRRRRSTSASRRKRPVASCAGSSSTTRPKHASWLNMVEIEIGVMVRQCLDRRIPDKETLVSEVAHWERRRNAEKARIKWMFTVERAGGSSAEPTRRPSRSSREQAAA